MKPIFEKTDFLNAPYEAFILDTDQAHLPVHSHWHYFVEILYVLEGIADVEYDGFHYTLKPTQMLFIHPRAMHAIYTTHKERLRFAVIKFDIGRIHVTSSYTPKFRAVFRHARTPPKLPVIFSEADFSHLSLQEIFLYLIRELEERQYGYDIQAEAKTAFLLTEIIRFWMRLGFQTGPLLGDAEEGQDFHEILEYIAQHSGENLKAEDLARKYHMSYSHFARTFKYLYDQTFKEYLEFIRLSKAADFLLFTDYDLNFISQETGFSDSSHLIRQFRNRYGMTPKQYRRARTTT